MKKKRKGYYFYTVDNKQAYKDIVGYKECVYPERTNEYKQLQFAELKNTRIKSIGYFSVDDGTFVSDEFNVYCDGEIIAQLYCSDKGFGSEPRILQGMNRDKTFKKIINDMSLMSFIEKIDTSLTLDTYWPKVFTKAKFNRTFYLHLNPS